MENAIYEGKMIVAYDVSKDYNFEEQVRSASGRRELRCPDPECKNPTVKYCHGDKKDAYFAHIDNDSCNYAKYDRSNDEDIRRIQRKLYCHFKDKFNVCMDYKVSSNCYAHLLIEIDDFNKIGVRIVKETKSPTESEIKRTTEDFNNKCIILRWIVIGDTSCEVIEDKVCWIKRELLNKDNNLIIVEDDGSENGLIVSQYRLEKSKYTYNGKIYCKSKSKDKNVFSYCKKDVLYLNICDMAFYLEGFETLYAKWSDELQKDFENKMTENTFKEQNVNKISKSDKKTTRSNRYNVLPTKAFIERNPKAMDLINRNEFPVYDTDGKRWVKCRICGMIGISERFKTYKYASGVCDECIKAQKW